jgi:hypothetical protein
MLHIHKDPPVNNKETGIILQLPGRGFEGHAKTPVISCAILFHIVHFTTNRFAFASFLIIFVDSPFFIFYNAIALKNIYSKLL